MPRFIPSGFVVPSKCLVPTPGLNIIIEYLLIFLQVLPHVQCVCVCVYAHIHPHTLLPTSRIREDTDDTPISLSVQKKTPRQLAATSALPDHLNLRRLAQRVQVCIVGKSPVRATVVYRIITTQIWCPFDQRIFLDVHSVF